MLTLTLFLLASTSESSKRKSILETILPYRPKASPEQQKERNQRASDDIFLNNPGANEDGVAALTLVVDDRVEVWERTSRPQILQVVPWCYYRDEAQRQVSMPHNIAIASDQELR